MSNLIKEDDLDSFLDSYLKSLILPKIIGLSGPLGAGKTIIEWANLMAEANIPIMDLIEINIVDEHTREIFINV